MTDNRRRKRMIRERMRLTGLNYIAASKEIGTWWAENMPGQNPKTPQKGERDE